MPIYEYWCTKCGKEFEMMRPMSQSSEPGTCPTCGSKAEKVPSVFASKENYTIKVPRGPAFRQRGAAVSASAAPVGAAAKTTRTKAASAKPVAAKAAGRASTAAAPPKAAAGAKRAK